MSVVHIHKGPLAGPYRHDGREVPIITAYLFHDGGDEDPEKLQANANKSFQGSIVFGMGFTFDDTDKKGIANLLALKDELIAENPRNAERIFPYIGGEEVNTSPTQAHHRYVINFEDFPLRREDLGARWAEADERQRRDWLRRGIVPLDYPDPVAADWPDLLATVEAWVKPERDRNNREVRRRYWWKFAERAPALYTVIAPLDRVMAISRVGEKMGLAFLPAGSAYAESLVIFALNTYAVFCLLQSSMHEVRARFSASMKDDLRYTPSDCFEAFPSPEGFETNPALEAVGERFYTFRTDLMVQNNEGLTKTCDRFHDPEERSNAIAELRALHDKMDRAVLHAYGWDDLEPVCEFELEWEDDEDEENGARRRKKPWRYRWPEEVRDEVLARLLDLNRQHVHEEKLVSGRTAFADCRKRCAKED